MNSNYTNNDYNLTDKEQGFIKIFLSENGCGAQTPSILLGDNFSCQCIEDLNELFSGLTKNQIGGFLSSLQEKGVLMLDKRDGPIFTKKNMWTFEPDLYTAEEGYLQSLPGDLDFYDDEDKDFPTLRKDFF